MALSTVIKNFLDGSIVLKDGTATPLTCTVSADGGDFAVSGLRGDTLNSLVQYESRGRLTSVRHGARIFPQVSFTCQMKEFTNATAGVVADFVNRTGAYAAAVSTLGASADVFTFDITFTVEGTAHGDGADSTMILTDVACTAFDFSEGDPNTFSFTGICYGEVTGVATER